MGEALYRLERIDLENLHVKIPDYRKIIGLRNILAHGYDIVDNAALWDFVVTKVPDLKKKRRLTSADNNQGDGSRKFF